MTEKRLHGGDLAQLTYPVLYLGFFAIIVLGVSHFAKALPIYWTRDGALDLVTWAAGCFVAALAAKWVSPKRPHVAFLAAVAVYLAVGAGVMPSAAAALFFASCYFCGRAALRVTLRSEDSEWGVVKPMLIGLALELALFGLLIHFPVNLRRVYLAILIAPIVLGLLGRPAVSWRKLMARAPAFMESFHGVPFWWLAITVVFVGFAARFAFLPAVDYDGNAVHLRLWTELSYLHRYSFNVRGQVWDAEPFAMDLLRAVVSHVAGAEAHGAVGLGLLALVLSQLWTIARACGVQAKDRLLLLALLASTPMTGSLVMTGQSELLLAFLATAGVALVLEARPSTYRSDVVAVLAVAALCCATKLPGAVLGVLLLLAGLFRIFAARDRAAPWFEPKVQWPILLFVAAFSVTALSSYLTAWRITGNPLFPLFNGYFKSAYFPPQNFSDQRWIKGFTLSNFVGLFFRTSEFSESGNFTAGFQYLFLLPLGLIVLFRRVPWKVALIICAPLLGFGLLMFAQTQYWRYLFPILPLGTAVIGALLIPGAAGFGAPATRLFVGLCSGLNIFFYPGVVWFFANATPQAAFTQAGKDQIAEMIAPVKPIVEAINRTAPDGRVLFPESTPFGATLHGEPVYVNWYSPGRQARFASIRGEADVAAFLHEENVKHVIWDQSETVKPGEPRAFLRDYLNHHAVPQKQVGGFVDYGLFGKDPAYRVVLDVRQLVAGGAGQLDLPRDVATRMMSSGGLTATREPLVVAETPSNWATIMRYHARFQCADASGSFIAQVNWDKGPAYYRLVPCDKEPVDFEEAVPIPPGASHATAYITVRDGAGAKVSELTLETN